MLPEVAEALAQFGTRVRSLREQKGLTQEAAASAAHLDGKHIQAIERGHANITLATMLGLARGLDVPLVSLVRGIGERPKGK